MITKVTVSRAQRRALLDVRTADLIEATQPVGTRYPTWNALKKKGLIYFTHGDWVKLTSLGKEVAAHLKCQSWRERQTQATIYIGMDEDST